MRPPWMRYLSVARVYTVSVAAVTLFSISRMRSMGQPARAARAAASTCQPSAPERVLVS